MCHVIRHAMAGVVVPDEYFFPFFISSNSGCEQGIIYLLELLIISVFVYHDLIICCVENTLKTLLDNQQVVFYLWKVLEPIPSRLISPVSVEFIPNQIEESAVGNKR